MLNWWLFILRFQRVRSFSLWFEILLGRAETEGKLLQVDEISWGREFVICSII